MKLSPVQFIVLGFGLVIYGMVIPWLMVLRIIQPTIFLSFSSYAATFTGLILGTVGVATYVRNNRRNQ